MNVRQTVTAAEAAAIIGVSPKSVYNLVRRGLLPRLPGLGVVLIPRGAVDDYLQGEYDAQSHGPRQGTGDDRPDEDAEGGAALADRGDDGRREAGL